MAALVDTLTETLAPLAGQHGLELVAVDVAGAKGAPLVRVYLDREGGIDLEALASANAWLTDALDNGDALRGAYTLEVSSPGIERPLRTREHFVSFTGSRAKVHTTHKLNGRSHFTGIILGVEGDDVLLDADGTEHRIPLDAVTRARLKVDFDALTEGSGRPR
jgi:ribosome maturation factor RimP